MEVQVPLNGYFTSTSNISKTNENNSNSNINIYSNTFGIKLDDNDDLLQRQNMHAVIGVLGAGLINCKSTGDFTALLSGGLIDQGCVGAPLMYISTVLIYGTSVLEDQLIIQCYMSSVYRYK
jgi:hypothetical protein